MRTLTQTMKSRLNALKISLIVLLLVGFAQSGMAAPHPIQWASRHKLLIVTSAVMFAASAADAQSSIEAEKRCAACVEMNPFVGSRPSTPAFWSFTLVGNSGVTFLNWHLLKRNRSSDKAFILTLTGVAASLHAYAAYHNAGLPTVK